MRLHYAKNTIAAVVAITLEEANIVHELVKVDFATAAQTKPDYLAINPKGRVPALELEDGRILTETGAIIEYVAGLSADTGLIPDDPFQAAKMREVIFYVASTMHVNHAHRMRGHRWATEQASFDDMAAKVPSNMTASADHIETECLVGPFVLGANISLADFYLYAVSCWLEGDGVDVSAFPKLTAFRELMASRDSVKAVRAAGVLS